MENYIGDNIHAIRGNFGLSQEQLAAIAEVSQTSVSAWECGQTIPRFSNAVKIVESLPSLTMDDVYSQVLGRAQGIAASASRVWIVVRICSLVWIYCCGCSHRDASDRGNPSCAQCTVAALSESVLFAR